VAETYSQVARIRKSPDLGLARSVGAYRAAMSKSGFSDAVSILACASLESLVASYKSDVVIRRVARYVPTDSAAQKLERLYLLRQWFAHGATIRAMTERDVRDRTLADGLDVVKEILRTAYADERLMKAARSGVEAVWTYLGR
jgi:hypothetical protein